MLRTLLDRLRDLPPEAERIARGLLENILAGRVERAGRARGASRYG